MQTTDVGNKTMKWSEPSALRNRRDTGLRIGYTQDEKEAKTHCTVNLDCSTPCGVVTWLAALSKRKVKHLFNKHYSSTHGPSTVGPHKKYYLS